MRASTRAVLLAGIEDRYSDALQALRATGVPTEAADTGGGCTVLYCRLEGSHHLLVSDVTDPLAVDRDDQQGWGVALYRDGSEADSPECFRSTGDASAHGLVELVRQTLTELRH